MMRVYFKTFGCQMNENDTLYMEGVLEREGFEIVEDPHMADIAIVNTCAVRKKAEDKFYGKLGELLNIKRERGLIIGTGGCLAEKEREKLLDKGVDFVFGTRSYPEISGMIRRALSGERFVYFDDLTDSISADTPRPVKGHHMWVTVIYGCDRFCTYCIVPYTRGREKSRPLSDVLEEVERLARKGVREVTFLGQNVDAYGKDLEGDVNLAVLLEEASRVEGIERLWFLTSYPTDFSSEIIDVVAENPRVAKSVHLPVQSGSDRILKLMNRRYSRNFYLDLLDEIRRKIPDVSISSDIIVGFPGETEEDFEETLDLVRKARFERLNIAIYSPREGTLAHKKMRDDVPRDVKIARFQTLLNLQKSINREMNESYAGKTVRIIVEARAKNGLMYGRDMRNKIIAFEGSDDMIGKYADVKITKITAGPLYGRLVWLENLERTLGGVRV